VAPTTTITDNPTTSVPTTDAPSTTSVE
jgi:hypothetical protein